MVLFNSWKEAGKFLYWKKRSFIEMNVSSVGTEKIFIEMCANWTRVISGYFLLFPVLS